MSRLLLISSAISIAGLSSIYLYAKYLHSTLTSQVTSVHVTAGERAAYATNEIESIPVELLEKPEHYRVIHVKDTYLVDARIPLKDDEGHEIFTRLLRRNMSRFARMPQAWFLRLLATEPERRRSFSQSHNLALQFKPGDLSCGFNRVVRRDSTIVEFSMEPPEGMGTFSARMIIRLIRDGDGTLLTTENIQWTEVGDLTVLPLERKPAKFMHEVASWWLLVTGGQYLAEVVSAHQT